MPPSSWYKTFMPASDVEVGPTRYTGPPMDLANMRKNGVRSLSAHCLDCHHNATVNVDAYPGELAVPSFACRMKCSQCLGRQVHVMPAWNDTTLMSSEF